MSSSPSSQLGTSSGFDGAPRLARVLHRRGVRACTRSAGHPICTAYGAVSLIVQRRALLPVSGSEDRTRLLPPCANTTERLARLVHAQIPRVRPQSRLLLSELETGPDPSRIRRLYDCRARTGSLRRQICRVRNFRRRHVRVRLQPLVVGCAARHHHACFGRRHHRPFAL